MANEADGSVGLAKARVVVCDVYILLVVAVVCDAYLVDVLTLLGYDME